MIKRLLWALAVLAFFGLAGVGALWYLFIAPKGVAVDEKLYPVRGIDVSMHTGNIDWQAVKNQGIQFAYIKATEGEDYVDPRFRLNLSAARKAGIPAGAYHFFRFGKDGAAQARHFLRTYTHQQGDLPPVIDVENWAQGRHGKSKKAIQRAILDCIHTVQTTTGRRPVVYSNHATYNEYLVDLKLNNPVWICAFSTKKPKLRDGRPWLFWQHAHNGKLQGVQGWVDLNVFNGDQEAWGRYIQ